MKLISYNLNGIRSALSKGLLDWLREENPDVFMVQELKATEDQIPLVLFAELGYTFYVYPAQRKGYSGTAIFSKVPADYVKMGINDPLFDSEGRLIRTDFGELSLICSYFPSGSSGEVRQKEKMRYLSCFSSYIGDLRKTRPNIIVGGDYNICHKAIDINNPGAHEQTSGFLPEERAWFDGFISDGFIDTFRVFSQEPEKYSWWSFRAASRRRNLGWRIDYFMASESLRPRLLGADILTAAVHSDHCPVELTIL